MSDFRHEFSDATIQLENLLRSAGRYVQPTDDLRPQVLEAAKSACRQQRTNHGYGTLVLLMVLAAATGIPGYLLRVHRNAELPSEQVERRAALRAVESGIGHEWALYEVFNEQRREQAEQWGGKPE